MGETTGFLYNETVTTRHVKPKTGIRLKGVARDFPIEPWKGTTSSSQRLDSFIESTMAAVKIPSASVVLEFSAGALDAIDAAGADAERRLAAAYDASAGDWEFAE